jgi:hypothetical protein
VSVNVLCTPSPVNVSVTSVCASARTIALTTSVSAQNRSGSGAARVVISRVITMHLENLLADPLARRV